MLQTIKTSLFISLLLIFRVSSAADYNSPEGLDGAIRIDAENLIKLAQKKNDLVIIDSRIESDRRQGYITESISLPDTQTSCSSLFAIIKRKSTPTVFYCNGPRCRRSDHAVTIAVDCGYTNIYWFRGGFEEWKGKNYLIHK